MGTSSRLHWFFILLVVVATAVAAPAFASSPSVQLARLDADPVPLQVLTGKFDADFVDADLPIIREPSLQPRWWRVTVDRDVPAAGSPQLLLQTPHLNRVEAWTPGNALPVLRSLVGPHADLRFSTRALVVPLPDGLQAGQAVYLRVRARSAAPMRVSVEPLAAVHQADLRHVAWRTVAMTSLALLSILALGFWIGIGERGYVYLSLTLMAQCAFLAVSGGEIRVMPELADIVGNDIRIARVLGLLAVVSGLVFMSHYLDLRNQQPRLMRVIDACCLLLGVLMVVALASTSYWIAVTGNVLMVVGVVSLLVATVVGALQRRQRSAYVLLLAWTPLVALLVMRTGYMLGIWVGPPWINYALPLALSMWGMIITIGLTDTLQQLRRDRDHASRQATYDGMTDTLTRPAIEQRLTAAVGAAHESGRSLSVVFFDIDNFKRINDEFGHRVGDGCLRIVSLRTRNRLRTYDQIGRWGGDEMIVVLPDTRLGEALGVAENLRSAINCRELSIDGHLIAISLSLGVAELAAGESAEHLLERADSALYTSKQAGRDRVTGHDPRVTGSHARFVASTK